MNAVRRPHGASETAYVQALEQGDKTRDLGGGLGTKDFARAVIGRLAD